MRQVSVVIAVTLLGAAVAGCVTPYQPRYGYAYQTYPAYTVYQTAPVQVAYVTYPATYTTYPASYSTYRSYDYDRNYMGIHPGPELKRAFP
jgi:hypothetical protein